MRKYHEKKYMITYQDFESVDGPHLTSISKIFFSMHQKVGLCVVNAWHFLGGSFMPCIYYTKSNFSLDTVT